MIINLTKSDLFTKDPDIRFALEYGLPRGLWNLLFNRAKYLEYSVNELCELYQIKTKSLLGEPKVMPYTTMKRWIWRTEIYNRAIPFVKKGAETVVSEVFGEFEEELLKELGKHLRNGETKDSRILI